MHYKIGVEGISDEILLVRLLVFVGLTDQTAKNSVLNLNGNGQVEKFLRYGTVTQNKIDSQFVKKGIAENANVQVIGIIDGDKVSDRAKKLTHLNEHFKEIEKIYTDKTKTHEIHLEKHQTYDKYLFVISKDVERLLWNEAERFRNDESQLLPSNFLEINDIHEFKDKYSKDATKADQCVRPLVKKLLQAESPALLAFSEKLREICKIEPIFYE